MVGHSETLEPHALVYQEPWEGASLPEPRTLSTHHFLPFKSRAQHKHVAMVLRLLISSIEASFAITSLRENFCGVVCHGWGVAECGRSVRCDNPCPFRPSGTFQQKVLLVATCRAPRLFLLTRDQRRRGALPEHSRFASSAACIETPHVCSIPIANCSRAVIGGGQVIRRITRPMSGPCSVGSSSRPWETQGSRVLGGVVVVFLAGRRPRPRTWSLVWVEFVTCLPSSSPPSPVSARRPTGSRGPPPRGGR